MIILALIIGLFGGTAAVLFRLLIKKITFLSYPGASSILNNIIASPWYLKIIIPATGGLLVGLIVHFLEKDAEGHGVPEVMESVILKGGIIRPKVTIIKAIISSITIGTGGSAGREGPIIGIGAGIGSSIGQFFKLSPNNMKTLLGCGASAGLAAAFNTPIAGALFSVEVLLGDFAFSQFSPIVISSVMATVISHQFEGNFAAFQVPEYSLVSPFELILYSLLGFLCAYASYIFIKMLYCSEDFFENRFQSPKYIKPAIGGALIGLIAILFPQIMGIGYESIDNALHGKTIWYIAFALIFVKILSTSITLGSGGVGGIFVPSLFLGAMTGCFFGFFMHSFFPTMTASPGAYALVAMGGVVAGTMHAPLTAIIIVFELTNDYHIILPLMITCIISMLFSTKLSRESIYTLKLLKRNIHIKDGTETNVMESIFVKDVYTSHVETIQENSNFNEVVNRIISGTDPCLAVTDNNGALTGLISIHDVKGYLFEREMLKNVLIAGDIAIRDIEPATSEDNCQKILDRMSAYNLEGVPVVHPKKQNKLLGMIWRKDIHDAYNKEIARRDITSSFATRITMKNIDQNVHFMEGYAIKEIAVPRNFVGKSIKELNIRGKYGVDVILIRNNTDQGSKIKAIPSPDYIFSYNDSLVIAGEIGKINRLKSIM